MVISETQLETWSNQGATATAKATHESIRNALSATTSPIRNLNYEVYLQGSYKNSTNIRGDSDVDIVVQLNSSFQPNITSLSEDEINHFRQSYDDASYLWNDFRRDVLQALEAHYTATIISEGNKSLKVGGGSGRLPADVIASLQYRKFKRFLSTSDQEYIEGIAFYSRNDGRRIINYPKQHYENGVRKNNQSNTKGWYKPTVRLFKNARTYLVDQGSIVEESAPSYFLECLIYNIPNAQFGGSYQDTFCNLVNWLNTADLSNFMCQNGLTQLFGNSPEQWSLTNAKTLVDTLADLWNNWR
jgi:hypothetical protein